MSESTSIPSEVASMNLGEKEKKISSPENDREQKGKKRPQSWWRDSDKKKKKKKEQPQIQAFSENLDKARKIAMFIGYSGKDYRGIQFQREENIETIEGDLFKALIQVGLIEEKHLEDLKQISFQRASRTDKGVSAIGNVLSLKMLLNVENAVQKLNEALPEKIRVYGYLRTTKGFNCKKMCTGRTYIYILPTLAFAPMEEIVTPEYRVTDNIIAEVNRILQRFVGTHNFHNYTSQVKPTDANANRYIVSFKCSEPFVADGMEFAQITVDGQSFMLHQIRKMIGITIAIVKGHYNEDALDKSWGPEKLDIPKAPGLGLVLESLHFKGYNRNFGGDGLHKPISWEPYKKEMEAFKEKYIIPEILKTEREEQNMMDWLAFLINHSDDRNTLGEDRKGLSRDKIDTMAKNQAAAVEDSSIETADEDNTNKDEINMMEEPESCEIDRTKVDEINETKLDEMDKNTKPLGHNDPISAVTDSDKDNVTVPVLDNSGNSLDICKNDISDVNSQK